MDIKERIKQRINDINDPKLLEELLKAVELESEIEHLEDLTEDEKKAIDKGISDADSGKLHSNLEASQLVKEWLKK
jgi:predicted transcriptional regulator